jgi:hypothetical protein
VSWSVSARVNRNCADNQPGGQHVRYSRMARPCSKIRGTVFGRNLAEIASPSWQVACAWAHAPCHLTYVHARRGKDR